MDGICVKFCHCDAGPVRLFNDRPISFCSLRRNIGEYLFNSIFFGVPDILLGVILLKSARATTGLGTSLVIPTELVALNDVFFFYLGAIATLVAAYLARARGSNEPELSITRCKDLDQFIRKCKAFQMDHGHVAGNELDKELIDFRHEFEELLGNANG